LRHLSFTALVVGALLLGSTPSTQAKIAGNKLAGNTLAAYSAAANSAAASRLAASSLAVEQLAPDTYALDPVSAAELLATEDGREVLSFILSCALPENVTLRASTPEGEAIEFFGDIGLADEWLHHPLREAGRGWVSACLFARVNAHSVPLPISLRGPNKALAATREEAATYTLEEGAFYGDYFVSPGETLSWIACRGADQASGEIGGLISRDCAEPAPGDPTLTDCGFTYAGDCGEFAPEQACKHFAPHDIYRTCYAAPIGDAETRPFREVITVYVLP